MLKPRRYKRVTPAGGAPAATGSALINNGTINRVSAPVNTGFDFGTGDFTVETYVRFTSITAVQAIITNYLNSTTGWVLEATSTGWLFYNGDALLASYVSTPVIDTWYHIAVARSGTSLKMFLNGAQVASVVNSTNITGSTNVLSIGALLNTLYGVFGYVSNLRIVKGTAVYTSAFTPPTTPLTAITNTSLLALFNGTPFVDTGPNNLTLTVTGSVPYSSSVSPF
jgi:hypothetical protein